MPSPSPPAVAAYTPRAPYSVGPKEPLGNARRLMEKYFIRDLPVRAEGKLVGLLSERDLRLVWKLTHPPPETLDVEQAMTAEPYTVTSSDSVDEVVRVMLERGIDAAVVLDDAGHITGVFTATNAMEALVDLLEPKRTRPGERSKPAQTRRAMRGRDPR